MRPVMRTDSAFEYGFFNRLKYSPFILLLRLILRENIIKLVLISLFHIIFDFDAITFVYILNLRLSSDGQRTTILLLNLATCSVKILHSWQNTKLSAEVGRTPPDFFLRSSTGTQVSDAVKFNMADRVHRLSPTASGLFNFRHFGYRDDNEPLTTNHERLPSDRNPKFSQIEIHVGFI